jgi:hypothetical protein
MILNGKINMHEGFECIIENDFLINTHLNNIQGMLVLLKWTFYCVDGETRVYGKKKKKHGFRRQVFGKADMD